ncbi:MAG: imidazole glycerol phosphate synthase subunit HisH [Oscillospiraceae bacterium]|nr:imidazole glycerol phosphate synthase subunit HisH [Oscillospiraceae bacterium]
MIAIIDYGAGNLHSVQNALNYIKCECKVITNGAELQEADAAILPGVGSFADAMSSLNKSGLVEPIKAFIASGKPFLGICLGLQLLFESSEESPGVAGLGLLKGHILRIPEGRGLKIPHIGWNSLEYNNPSPLFAGLAQEPYVYFVHSYYLKSDEDIVTASTRYGVKLHASVQKGNVFATQFHPEKSGDLGIQMLRNFIALQGEI